MTWFWCEESMAMEDDALDELFDGSWHRHIASIHGESVQKSFQGFQQRLANDYRFVTQMNYQWRNSHLYDDCCAVNTSLICSDFSIMHDLIIIIILLLLIINDNNNVTLLLFLEFFLWYSKAPMAATEQHLNLCVCPLWHRWDMNTRPSALVWFTSTHYTFIYKLWPQQSIFKSS